MTIHKNGPPLSIFALMIGILIGLFALLRLINLTIIPIFTDEAIYLRWAQIGAVDPRWRFISLIDGKQPLFIWLVIPFVKYLPHIDPLVLGRLISVFLGFVGMTGLAVFSWYKTKSWKGFLVGGLVYLLLPIYVVYDRLAIYEALLSAISIWALFFTYLFGKKLRLDLALILGFIIGAGLLTKSSANFFLYLLPATFLLRESDKNENKGWKWIGLMGVVVLQSGIYAAMLLFSEFRHVVAEKNLQFIYSLSEIASQPYEHFWGNLKGLTGWFIGYSSWPVLILIIASVIWHVRRNAKEALFFLLYFMIPFLGLAMFGKVIYPRFLIFMLPGLLIPLSMFLVEIVEKRNRLWLAVLGVALVFVLYFDVLVITNPIHAPIPTSDRQQLINDWPAGYGIKEVAAYIEEEAKNGPVVLATEGTFGLYPMALELYLGTNRNVTIKAYWPLGEIPQELRDSAKMQPTFVMYKERQIFEKNWPIELIQKYQRGDGPTYLYFFRVLP